MPLWVWWRCKRLRWVRGFARLLRVPIMTPAPPVREWGAGCYLRDPYSDRDPAELRALGVIRWP